MRNVLNVYSVKSRSVITHPGNGKTAIGFNENERIMLIQKRFWSSEGLLRFLL